MTQATFGSLLLTGLVRFVVYPALVVMAYLLGRLVGWTIGLLAMFALLVLIRVLQDAYTRNRHPVEETPVAAKAPAENPWLDAHKPTTKGDAT